MTPYVSSRISGEKQLALLCIIENTHEEPETMPKLTTETLMKALNWAYDNAVDGLPGSESVEELASDYARRGGTPREQAEALIRWQVAKAGTSGFITGLPGAPFLPLTLPASLMSVFYIQLRMIAAIAHLGGYDVRSDQVRTVAFACLVGKAGLDELAKVGALAAVKAGNVALAKLPGALLIKINKFVGFRFITKFGSKGVVNLGKGLPLLGGLVGAGFDVVSTRAAGQMAIKLFLDNSTTTVDVIESEGSVS